MADKTDFAAAATRFKARLAAQRDNAGPERNRHIDLMEATCDEAAKRLAKAKDRAGARKVMDDLHAEHMAAPLADGAADSARSEPIGPITHAILDPAS
jgi:hypothetical protein